MCMKVTEEYRERALALHQSCPVADAHLDLAGELLFRVRNGEKNPLRTHYLKNLRAGGFDLIVSSVYLRDEELPERGLREALDQISVLYEAVRENEEFLLVRTAADIDRALEQGRIGILLYLEGMDFIGNDLRLLPVLWELGVRGASLTWSRRNLLASGCCRAGKQTPTPGGLSADGLRALAEMERLGMFVDVSHLNDDGFRDICGAKPGGRPFVATHSNSRDIFFSYRNLTDEQMRLLAAQGGVMGLNGCDCIVGCGPGEDALEMMCRHIEHMAKVAGADHVGYGFDFCDSYTEAEPRLPRPMHYGDCLGDHSRAHELTAALLMRGVDEETVKKVIGGNWLRYFKGVLPGGHFSLDKPAVSA